MRPRLGHILADLGLAFAAAVLVLGVCSDRFEYFLSRGVDTGSGYRVWSWWCEDGRIGVRWIECELSGSGAAAYWGWLRTTHPELDGTWMLWMGATPQAPARRFMSMSDWRWHGFTFSRQSQTRPAMSGRYAHTRRDSHTLVAIPNWLVALLLAVPTMIRVKRFVRGWRRRRRGECVRCGYDLRATPERCPECGEVPKASREVAEVKP